MNVTPDMAEAAQEAWERAVTEGLGLQLPAWSSLLPMREALSAALAVANTKRVVYNFGPAFPDAARN